MPNADGRGMYCTDIDKEKIEKAIAEIQQGGKENVLGLIEHAGRARQRRGRQAALRLALPGQLRAAKPQGRAGPPRLRRGPRRATGSDRSKYVRAYLCQELQWAGRREACPALGKLLCDEDLTAPAAMALVAIRDGAAEQFRAALAAAKGTCKLNIVQGLGPWATRNRSPGCALLTDEDREVRLAAGWGLARMGDAGSVDPLIKAAGVPDGWERIQATKHCLVLAEKLTAAGKKTEAAKIYAYLRDSRKD